MPQDQEEQFIAENVEWIRDVEARLEAYLSSIPESQHFDIISIIMSGESSSRNANYSANDYFISYMLHQRNGFTTYSMEPRLATKLNRSTMEAGWRALGLQYSGIRNDRGAFGINIYATGIS